MTRKTDKKKKLQGTYRKDRAQRKRKIIAFDTRSTEKNELSIALKKLGLLETRPDEEMMRLFCEYREIADACMTNVANAGGISKYLKGKNSQTMPELILVFKARDNMQKILKHWTRRLDGLDIDDSDLEAVESLKRLCE